jgi:alpha-D-ribose 1-methylphosphonate 5-triphosphate synthase subunit PhnH
MIEAGVSGLDDASIDSAVIFRATLDAMARPGRVVALTRLLAPPPPLFHTTAQLCVTLCDYDTPMWIEPRLRAAPVADYVCFQTGAPIRDDVEGARFIICDAQSAAARLAAADQGTPEYPDHSATLIVQVESFRDACAVVLTGPGIAVEQEFAAAGIGEEFWQVAARNHALYPLGADVIFASPSAIAGLPRSIAIAIMGCR